MEDWLRIAVSATQGKIMGSVETSMHGTSKQGGS
jgi:hypothetical protein